MDMKPYEGELEFATEGNTDFILAHAPEEIMPGEGESRNHNGLLEVGVIYQQQDGRTVLETQDTPEVFSLDQMRQILKRMEHFAR